MDDKDILLKDLTGKDENKAQNAANHLINNSDTELFRMLADKSDFLFPFIRNNVSKRIEKAINKENFSNIIKFFDYYCPYYDDLFASILAKHANQDLTDVSSHVYQRKSLFWNQYSCNSEVLKQD